MLDLEIETWLAFNFGDDNPNNRIVQIRALVDDRVVFREWSEDKERWRYFIEPVGYFRSHYETGFLQLATSDQIAELETKI